ncbi:enoyl-CoA hydratase/isomerase family protein [Herbiconiux sp. P17]|uniref:enoyl-CoA hydratase/isomerase family protein n=1 Tax=Herbiconiux wuyangfengii TaxID=3342794 RepID=UPI0035B9DDEE
MPSLTLRYDGELAIIEIANPPHNRFTEDMRQQLDAILADVEQGPARALLIKGNSEVFSHGLDISRWPDYGPDQLREALARFLDTFNRFESLPIPTVAAVTGTCTGGAYELILRADFVIAAASARFGSTEESLGMVTAFGGIIRTAERAGRAFATDVAFNSTVFSAAMAEQRGIITRTVPDDDLDHEIAELTEHLVHGPTAAYRANKAMLNRAATAGVSATEVVILDISMPAIASQDAHRALVSAVDALARGEARPPLAFDGR